MPNAPVEPRAHPHAAGNSNGLIERSWQRCRVEHASQLDAEPLGMARGELHDLLACQSSLLDAAQPEMEQLASLVNQAASVVLLADAHGVILRSEGSAEFLARAERVALRPGVDWSETHRGTNAIGTALVEGAPVRVQGAEHYLRTNRILSCNGAPIRSGRGELLGVLDISYDANTVHAYALGLAQMAARQVGNRLLRARSGQHRLVLQRNPNLLDTAERGVLLIEDGHVVGANEAAIGLLRTSWRELLDRPLLRFLQDWQGLRDTPGLMRTVDGERVYGALHRDGAETGARPMAPARSTGRATARAPAVPAPSMRPALPALPPALQREFSRSVRVLDAGLSTMLLGETGVGKEVYARHLHQASRWHHGPFVAVNCTALPETLIEAELFGYESGAFTGARRGGSRGLLREAHGGVLFLDEIGDMPLGLQARLLRVLQERVVQPLGAGGPVPVDFAVVCATHRDIEQCIAAGSFRADLFYRLQDFRIDLPPLRARDDLRGFIQDEFASLLPAPGQARLAAETLDELAAHPWPGNYRQLRAVLRTLALFAPDHGAVLPAHLPATLRTTAGRPLALREPTAARAAPRLDSLREQAVERCLREAGGNVSRAARALGVHRSTLYRYLERRDER
ncbi:sigma-54-dependent Fis family transcriptional regulator [Verticiella sediminum]|uniref:Sigma-54-dependent Fis family transcriptional regulator n=1 Tax=Verticiella sediminum TaxID=1247510 RepID=A0A556B172_9BURK|nr:sigma-54-dependent Fis family transcriptional regulator [Verticiella sediminum]TSH98936.1 sigma-54-dependent Fis family transcriptional regulator [Verticiella sediminum]